MPRVGVGPQIARRMTSPLTALLERVSKSGPAPKPYWDKSNYESYEAQEEACRTSSTCYVGNLSYYTSEEQIHEFFREAGAIKRVIMGLHRVEKTPCGFAFVEFISRTSAEIAETCLNGKLLDSRRIKVDIDPGFKELRQFGRGRAGGQVRDDFREDVDDDRGGLGALVKAGIHPSMSNESNFRKRPSPYGGGGGGGNHNRRHKAHEDRGSIFPSDPSTLVAAAPPAGEVTMSVEGSSEQPLPNVHSSSMPPPPPMMFSMAPPPLWSTVPPPSLPPPSSSYGVSNDYRRRGERENDFYSQAPSSSSRYPPPHHQDYPPPSSHHHHHHQGSSMYNRPPPSLPPPLLNASYPPPPLPAARPKVDEFGRDIGASSSSSMSNNNNNEQHQRGSSRRRRGDDDDE